MFKSIAEMALRDAIWGRRSVRAYSSEKIDKHAIEKLLDAAVRAPTAMHAEPWQFVVVQDLDKLKRLSDCVKTALAKDSQLHPEHHHPDIFFQSDFNVFYDAGTLVIICANAESPFTHADGWLAAENLMLFAHSIQLGTCVIGSAVEVLNMPEMKVEFNIPSTSLVVAPIIVGKPRGKTVTSARKAPQVLAWF